MSKRKPKQIESMADLAFDPNNANRGTARGQQLLEDSLRELEAGRGIVVDADGVVIAGNKTLEAARVAGIDQIEVVQTEGDALVVVQREDLDLDEEKGRKMAVADNRIGQLNLSWDPYVLDDLSKSVDLSVAGFEAGQIEAMLPPPPPPADMKDPEEVGQRTCVRIGEFRRMYDVARYDRWMEELRRQHGFNERDIMRTLLRRLGFDGEVICRSSVYFVGGGEEVPQADSDAADEREDGHDGSTD